MRCLHLCTCDMQTTLVTTPVCAATYRVTSITTRLKLSTGEVLHELTYGFPVDINSLSQPANNATNYHQ